MTKEEFDALGFTVETLPSGYLNICNTLPFSLNGTNTIACWSGKYFRTTNYKTISDLLEWCRIEILEHAWANSGALAKKKSHKIARTRLGDESPQQNQSLTAPESPKKRGRRKKTDP
jgi:hypothetical protein